MIGMNSVIMDDVVIGDECIIGALTFVPAETIFPNRKVVVGNPAKIIKDVSDTMIDWKTKGTSLYQQLPKDCTESLKECEPLREEEQDRPQQQDVYLTWKKNK
jgi:carbonic anhydrase/acetyltransferase-like protein (isoleucine patch superfamily)